MSSLLSCSATQDPQDNEQWGPAPITQHVHRRLPMSRERLWKFRPSSYLLVPHQEPGRIGVVMWPSSGGALGFVGLYLISKVLTKPALVWNWDMDFHRGSWWWCNADTALWLVSVKRWSTDEVDLSAVTSSQAGAYSPSSFFYCNVKRTNCAYVFIWPLSKGLITAGGIGAGWSAEPTGRSSVLGGLIWTQQAAVMGSGMSGGEGEVGVYVTHKHKCTSEWAPTSTWQSQRDWWYPSSSLHSDFTIWSLLIALFLFFCLHTRAKSELGKLKKGWYENHSNVVLKVDWVSKRTGLKQFNTSL